MHNIQENFMNTYKYCPLCGLTLSPALFDGRERMACACGFVHWDNPLPVVAAIPVKDGNIILARNKLWPENVFGLVTGFLENGESPEDGVKRELKEELGVDSLSVSLVGVYPFTQKNQVIIAYHVEVNGEISPGEELAEYKTVPIDKLKPWNFGTGIAVRDWLESMRGGGIQL